MESNLTESEIEKKFMEYLGKTYPSDEVEWVITEIIPVKYGWVLCYDTKKFLETRNEDSLSFTSPVLLSNKDKKFYELGTRFPYKKALELVVKKYNLDDRDRLLNFPH